eukprot:scaffold3050_cov362-Prasinococcus_capsulatus_cf.AAC.8
MKLGHHDCLGFLDNVALVSAVCCLLFSSRLLVHSIFLTHGADSIRACAAALFILACPALNSRRGYSTSGLSCFVVGLTIVLAYCFTFKYAITVTHRLVTTVASSVYVEAETHPYTHRAKSGISG